MTKHRMLICAVAGLLALPAIPVLARTHKAVSGVMPAEMRASESSHSMSSSETTTHTKSSKRLAKFGSAKSTKLTTHHHRAKTLLSKSHNAKTLLSTSHKAKSLIKHGTSATTTAKHKKHHKKSKA